MLSGIWISDGHLEKKIGGGGGGGGGGAYHNLTLRKVLNFLRLYSFSSQM